MNFKGANKMRKILVTIFFDIEHDKELEDRDYDRFIMEVDNKNFRKKFHEIIDAKKYSWDDFEKFKKGYKPIMETETIDLTDLEIF